MDNRGADVPTRREFVPVKVADEVLEKSRQPVADEVVKAAGATVFSGEPVLVDELADMEQEGVDAVVAVKLDASKVLRAKLDAPNRSKPAKHVMHVGARGWIKLLRFIARMSMDHIPWRRTLDCALIFALPVEHMEPLEVIIFGNLVLTCLVPRAKKL